MAKNLTNSYKRIVEKHYDLLESDGFFGLLRNNVSDISFVKKAASTYNDCFDWEGKKYFSKALKRPELNCVPPDRFVNSVLLSISKECTYNSCVKMVNPVGLIYPGKLSDLLYVDPENGCFVSDFVEGKTFLQIIGKMSSGDRKKAVGIILDGLADMRGTGGSFAYLFDFAPRDIIVPVNGHIPYTLVDTENLVFGSFDHKADLIDEQIKQFRVDYKDYLSKDELSELETILR